MLSSALGTVAPQHDVRGRLFLVNRDNAIHENYIPETTAADVKGQVRSMTPEAAAALKEMFDACKKQTGVTLVSVSGYRSYDKQNAIYKRKLKNSKGNIDKANEYVAPPGASEHQTGLAMDVGQQGKTNLSTSFASTKGGQWLREHCHEYGFIIRYDEGWENVTGYKYEPWHVRYVGKENAAKIHEAGVPLETWLIKQREENILRMLDAAKSGPVSADIPETAADTEPGASDTGDAENAGDVTQREAAHGPDKSGTDGKTRIIE